jgi:hypothetical protein
VIVLGLGAQKQMGEVQGRNPFSGREVGSSK